MACSLGIRSIDLTEPLQNIKCCIRRSMTPQNRQCLSRSTSSAMMFLETRQKQILLSRSIRLLSTSSSRCLWERSPSKVSESQPPETQPSSKPRPSHWASIHQGQRAHVTTPPSSSSDPGTVSQGLRGQLNVLDFVKPRSQGAKPVNSSTANGSSLMSRMYKDISYLEEKSTHDALEAVHLRLKPTLGRSVRVGGTTAGLDLHGAFKVLGSKLSRNHVLQDATAQRFHVRKGKRRKDLKRLRWRETFKKGFIYEVGRVKRMRRQGW